MVHVGKSIDKFLMTRMMYASIQFQNALEPITELVGSNTELRVKLDNLDLEPKKMITL
jgi:hypothetical protein